eukprot:4175996-Pyramimonas_sp.AAC.1
MSPRMLTLRWASKQNLQVAAPSLRRGTTLKKRIIGLQGEEHCRFVSAGGDEILRRPPSVEVV